MAPADCQSAEHLRCLITSGGATPELCRLVLSRISRRDRDAWLDLVFALEPPPDDGPQLPRGCVPYLPCAVDALLKAVDYANVQASDVFVDVGSGVGRTGALVQLLTGASVIGVEIQPQLIQASLELMARLKLARFFPIEGDARRLARFVPIGTVFFLNCPFGLSSFETFLDGLQDVAQAKEIRLCAVDLPVPPRRWLTRVSPARAECAVYRSTIVG